MLTLSDITLYFFVKKFTFSNVYIFSEDDVQMSLYVFWLRETPSVKYMRNWWGEGEEGERHGEGYPKCIQLRTEGGGVTLNVYVHTYIISFHVFPSIVILLCLVLIEEI